ncbi:MAG TPA: tRNA (adenosine(37)-N6)-dimethylallyltransferase MiaA [Gammaproteobacteria bacterium]|nr:tRNA (adenosine(37)-N6)-dimethylallyltransferase MiaA [Gammaproteobacteria bacterium]
MKDFLPSVFLMGPTASGKTDLAKFLVEKFPFEIISVDSAQVYSGMNIGTSKPDREFLEKVPHRLIDLRDPAETYSAAQFRVDALRAIEEIYSNGKVPLLAGGTMLYFRALERGLSQLPGADESVREKLEAEAAELGWAAMHERLGAVDSVAAQRIHPNDPQRIQRALEVYEITGVTLTEHYARQSAQVFPWSICKIIVAPGDRAVLRQRIEKRFYEMLELGLVDEVRALYERGDLHAGLPALRSVGYRQVWQYLDGEISYEDMIRVGVTATGQLAKRQMTWLRSEKNATWFDSTDSDFKKNVLQFVGDAVIC